MSTAGPEMDFEGRIATLERRVAQTIASVDGRVGELDARLHQLEEGPRRPDPRARLAPPAAAHAASMDTTAEATAPAMSPAVGKPAEASALPPASDRTAATAATSATAATAAKAASVADLVGGRVLAWLGGAAILCGLLLFLALAITKGWIGEEARVLLAGAGSLALLLTGTWLHANKGRTEAAVVMVGTATAGLFATLIVASAVYGLLPGLPAVAALMVVGGTAAALAIRWAGRAIGAFGLIGALLSPVLVGAAPSATTLTVLAVAAVCATAVVARQRWGWLAVATTLICAVQWSYWIGEGQTVAGDLLALGWFGTLGLVAAVAAPRRSNGSVAPASVVVAVLNACLLAVIGRIALGDAAGDTVGNLWLVALAAVYAAVGLQRHRRLPLPDFLRQVLIGLAVTFVDIALALGVDGLAQSVAWGATAVAFTWLARRSSSAESQEDGLDLGVGVHIALVIIRALLDAPPSALGTGAASLVALVSVATVAVSCAACGGLDADAAHGPRVLLNTLGLLAVAYLTALELSGAALVVGWAAEGTLLAGLARRDPDGVALVGALAFLAGALVHTLEVEAPPAALLGGAADLVAAATALGTLVVAALRIGLDRRTPAELRAGARWVGAALVLYLASVAIVTGFQPTAGTATAAVLDLSVRQQGQVLLSALWSVVGLVALIVGLRRNVAAVRTGALALLLVTVAKVFLYDLSTLTAGYRVASFIVLGLLLLTGAFAYQRVRPPEVPDLRTVHPSQR